VISTRITYDIPPEATVRDLEAASKHAVAEMLGYWWRNIMPGHFTVEGGKKYGYQPRAGEDEPERKTVRFVDDSGRVRTKLVRNRKYHWRKRPPRLPLVKTGASRAAARASFRVTTRKLGPDLVRGVLALPALPKYFYQYLQAGTYSRRTFDGQRIEFTLEREQPHKFEELTRIADDEWATLAHVYQHNFEQFLATRPRRPRRVAA
jgi:hypothetical protein